MLSARSTIGVASFQIPAPTKTTAKDTWISQSTTFQIFEAGLTGRCPDAVATARSLLSPFVPPARPRARGDRGPGHAVERRRPRTPRGRGPLGLRRPCSMISAYGESGTKVELLGSLRQWTHAARVGSAEARRAGQRAVMNTLVTERLILRPWRREDRAPFAELNADPEVMQHFPRPLTRAESDQTADQIEAH